MRLEGRSALKVGEGGCVLGKEGGREGGREGGKGRGEQQRRVG